MRIPLALIALLSAASTGAQQIADTTGADQTDVALTAYNNGLALVRDVRAITLPTGETHLRFMDVAQQIRPETVSLESVAESGSVTIIEQNYEYDLMSPEKLMEKYVGKTVKLINLSKDYGFDTVEAELLSVNNGPIYRVREEIHLGHPGNVVLPEIPENLIAKPTLIWLLNNRLAKQEIAATYLTNGVSWRADYVLNLARDDKSLDLDGWVTLDNNSGASYENARLKLVAGDVGIVRDDRRMRHAMAGMGGMMAEAAPPMPQQEAFAEYHLYTVPRRTTVRQNQSKQIMLLQAAGVACSKKYEYRGQLHFYSQPVQEQKNEHVAVMLLFENEEDNQLGIPLPGGIMRIYQEDSEGMLQFAGEDRIQHTPRNETVRLQMGQAFDVLADRTQTEYRRISDRTHEAAFKITLRNRKEEDVTVDVVEPMPGDWNIYQSSHPFEKRDARTAVFSVPVPSDGEIELTYAVRVTF